MFPCCISGLSCPLLSRFLFRADWPAGRRDGLETTPPSGLHTEAANRCCESCKREITEETARPLLCLCVLINAMEFQLQTGLRIVILEDKVAIKPECWVAWSWETQDLKVKGSPVWVLLIFIILDWCYIHKHIYYDKWKFTKLNIFIIHSSLKLSFIE